MAQLLIPVDAKAVIASAFAGVVRWAMMRILPRAMVGTVAAGAGVGFESTIVDLSQTAQEVPVSTATLKVLDEFERDGIIDRSNDLPSDGIYPIRDLSIVTTRYWHHTASANGATWDQIARGHIKRGWAGIGYHIGIDEKGMVAILNPLNRRTNHTEGHNSKGVGVVLLGNYDVNRPSEAMVKAIGRVRMYLDLIDITEERMHRETKSTACPGRYAVEYLDRTRDR